MSKPSDNSIARAKWIKKLLEILRTLDGGGYFVKRGPLNWATFNWPKKCAVSVRAAENFPPSDIATRTTVLELVVGSQIEQEAEGGTNDDVMDKMEEDMIVVMDALGLAKFTDGKGRENSLVLKVEHLGSLELNGSDFNMQGWFVTFKVEY